MNLVVKCGTCRRSFNNRPDWAGICERCDAPARAARAAALDAERAAFYADPARGPCECGECREHEER